MSPFLIGGGHNNWPEMQIPDFREKCPKCGNILDNAYGAIGDFPGHEHVYPSSVVGYQCRKCNRYFPVGEFLMLELEKEKTREKARSDFAKNYWQGVCAVFKSSYLYFIVVGVMLLGRSFWAGIAVGIIFAFLLPLLAKCLEMIFAPLGRLVLGRLVRKILPPDKPPDSPTTP